MRRIPEEIREAMKERDRLADEMDGLERAWRAAQDELRKQVELINRLWIEHRKRKETSLCKTEL